MDTKGKNKVSISFSGGRTSGYMTHRILRNLPNDVEARIVFANTGQEDERTLEFVHNCEKVFGWDITWVEAVTHHGVRKGPTHKIVDFETAARKGEPFEDAILKYGIPNQAAPNCTRNLKLSPMRSLIRSWGWKHGDYCSAVGIRADEIDRVSAYADKENLIYPLIKWKVKKEDVLKWWRQQNFDLDLPEHRGNCVTCWKKSYRKLVQVYREDPKAFDFFGRMERENGDKGTLARESGKKQVFFRGNKTVEDIRYMAEGDHIGYEDEYWISRNGLSEYDLECGESCEVFSDTSLKEDYE